MSVSLSLFLPDEDATLATARRMVRCMPQRSAPWIVYLTGDLGTGKTTFTRGLLHAMGEPGPVRSPTYGLIAEYATPRGQAVHIDLYRLRSAAELQSLGLADYLADSALWLIEWPERAAGAGLPEADVAIHLDVEAAGRRWRADAASTGGREWVGLLAADPG